jgi:tRNA(Ile)-lysidine synthase
LRYQWFEELLKVEGQRNFNYLLTAHHADDNIETLLMNFFKGTGVAGLTGIKPKDSGMGSHLIRPLLFATKNDILSFAAEQNIKWREDASNSSNKYTRNFFRNELLPSLEKIYPKVGEHLLSNITRFEEIQILYNHTVKQFSKKLLIETEDGFQIPILRLLKTPAYKTVLYELLKPYSFTAAQTTELLKLCNASNGKYVSSSTHRIIRNRKWLLLTKLNTNNNCLFVLDNKDMKLTTGDFTLSVQAFEGEIEISSKKDVVSLDSKEVSFPLLLRKWKQGDYFYPLGMTKKKKISRFLIDEKLSLPEKENVWVIESASRIVWVVGRRIDNRFKIKPSTKSFLRLSVSQ